MYKIKYLENFKNCETSLDNVFIPYKGVLRLSKLRYIKFSEVWKSLGDLMSFDIDEYKNSDILYNIVLGLDSLWEGMACIIRRSIEIDKSMGMQEILLPVCKFNTMMGHKAVNNLNKVGDEDGVIFFNGTYHRFGINEKLDASLLLGVPWSKLINESEGFYSPQEYVSFILQQLALIVTSYMEKEPSQYLITQTEAMKKSIYSNWDSIYKNYMPELEKQDMNQFMQTADIGREQGR